LHFIERLLQSKFLHNPANNQTNETAMKKMLLNIALLKKGLHSLTILFFLLLSNSIYGQTTLFHETFGTAAVATYTGGTSTTPSAVNYTDSTPSTTNSVALYNANDGYLNFVSSGANGRPHLSAPFTSLASGFNTTLANNDGVITWSFNIKTARTTVMSSASNTSYSDGSYSAAVVLGATSQNFLTPGTNGYVVIFQRSSVDATKNSVRLSTFTNGLVAGSAGATYANLIESAAFASLIKSISVKVTYNAYTGVWELFTREDLNST